MKKNKKILAVALLLPAVFLLLTACGKKATTEDASTVVAPIIKNAKTALKKGKYDQAFAYFIASNKVNHETKYKKYAAQSLALSSAQNKLMAGDFNKALAKLNEVPESDTSATIKTAKSSLSKKIVAAKKQFATLNASLKDAQTDQSNNKSSAALAIVDDLLDNNKFNTFYLQELQIEILELKSEILKTTADTSTNTNETTTSTSSSSSVSNSGTNDATNSGSTAISNGTVTSADIATARKQLQSLNLDDSSWSDADVASVILLAKRAGRTTITKADIADFLGN